MTTTEHREKSHDPNEPFRLEVILVEEVSLVDQGANNRPFLVTKAKGATKMLLSPEVKKDLLAKSEELKAQAENLAKMVGDAEEHPEAGNMIPEELGALLDQMAGAAEALKPSGSPADPAKDKPAEGQPQPPKPEPAAAAAPATPPAPQDKAVEEALKAVAGEEDPKPAAKAATATVLPEGVVMISRADLEMMLAKASQKAAPAPAVQQPAQGGRTGTGQEQPPRPRTSDEIWGVRDMASPAFLDKNRKS